MWPVGVVSGVCMAPNLCLGSPVGSFIVLHSSCSGLLCLERGEVQVVVKW